MLPFPRNYGVPKLSIVVLWKPSLGNDGAHTPINFCYLFHFFETLVCVFCLFDGFVYTPTPLFSLFLFGWGCIDSCPRF